MNRGALLACWLASACGSWCLPGVASASLGGDAESVNADRAALGGVLDTTSTLQFDQQALTLPSGAIVREYVTRNGQVFAISWQGPQPPDLAQLLGSYFARYTSAAAAQPGPQRRLSAAQTDFVVQAISHLRSFRGKAYLPALVPEGVAVEQLP